MLCAVCLASIVVVVVLGTRLTFFNDDWWFLLQRPGLESRGGLDVLLAPHNSNSVALTALAYKILVALFGLGTQLPYRVVLGIAIAAAGVALCLLVRSRMGWAIGVAAAAVLVLLGAAWEDLLFFASLDLIGSLATGLWALWVLQRDTPRRNALACALLVCSVAFSNVGVPFAVAAAVAVALRRRPSELWISIIPLALFALWWALYGTSEPSHLSAKNIEHLPRYLLDSLAAGLTSITGLNAGSASRTYARGHVLIAVGLAILVVCLLRGWRPRPAVLVPASALLCFWILTGASFIPGREPFASRYQLIDAALLILIAAELYRPTHVGVPLTAAIVTIAIVVVWSNIDHGLSYGYRFLRQQSGFAKADLAALRIGRSQAPTTLSLVPLVARNQYLSGVTAGRFFSQTAAHGPVSTYSVAQLRAASAPQRQAADSVLSWAEQIRPVVTADHPSSLPIVPTYASGSPA